MTTLKSREELLKEDQKLKAEIEKKHGKTVEQLRIERDKRVTDAIELRVPDRVPVTVGTGVFAARYAGLTASSAYYDRAAYREACKRMLIELEPDTGQAPAGNSGLLMELLDPKNQAWPGGTLPPDSTYQFVEAEFMPPEEYDRFLEDPTDYMLRCYWPRVYGSLAPLAKLPPLRMTRSGPDSGMGFTNLIPLLLSPEFRQIADKLAKVHAETQLMNQEAREFGVRMTALGFSSGEAGGAGGGIGHHPFDTISDYYRSMKGAMLDMYRRPEKLLAVLDKFLKWRADAAVPARPRQPGGIPARTGMPLHRGSDGFMSIKQFETFYWPYLKKSADININQLGYIFTPFWEGVWDNRLEYLLELPKGKVVFHCEKTDVFKAKEVIGSHMCIQGGVPPTLLEVGTPQEVEEHCKKLIKGVGKNGGFILGAGSSIECAKPANVKAMVEAVKKHGRY